MMTKNDSYTNLTEKAIKIKHKIADKFGDNYTVWGHLSKSGLLSQVYSRNHCVGRINWEIQDENIMVIWDIIIFPDTILKQRWWMKIPFLYKPPDYRGRGLGSAMLNYIIESARALNVSEIHGGITGDDLEKTPYLPEFYCKHGFILDDSKLTFYQMLS